jgi:hypothetical protein
LPLVSYTSLLMSRKTFVRLLDMLQERARIGAVSAAPVRGRLSGLGREGHDRAERRFDPGEPASDRRGARRAGRTLQAFGQRIVATGVEHQNAQVLCLLQVVHDVIHAYEALQIRFVGEHGIDRHQVVDAVELHRVSAVVEHGDVRSACGTRKADGEILHVGLAQVHALEDLETTPLEGHRNIFGIVRRIGQLRRVGIGAIADDQRHPRFRRCRRKAKPAGDDDKVQSAKSAHGCPIENIENIAEISAC